MHPQAWSTQQLAADKVKPQHPPGQSQRAASRRRRRPPPAQPPPRHAAALRHDGIARATWVCSRDGHHPSTPPALGRWRAGTVRARTHAVTISTRCPTLRCTPGSLWPSPRSLSEKTRSVKPGHARASATAAFLYRSTLKDSNPVISTTLTPLRPPPAAAEPAAPAVASQAPTASSYSLYSPACRCVCAASAMMPTGEATTDRRQGQRSI